MKILDFFRKKEKKEETSRFSDFFLNAPDKEKKRVLEKVAYKSNEEQLEVYTKARLKVKTTS